jgi:predicted ester cyclase
LAEADNKDLVRRYLHTVWEEGNIDRSDAFLAPSYRRHTGAGATPLDAEGQRARLKGFRSAFPDVHLQIEDMLAEGDLVAFRFTFEGTHRGSFQGIEPTGVRVRASGLDIVLVEEGRLAEHWGGVDLTSLVQQLRTRSS